jgi:hypothetical protein
MIDKPKYHPLVTRDAIAEARLYIRPDATDDAISQFLSDTFEMLEGWFTLEAQ